jgi:integrase
VKPHIKIRPYKDKNGLSQVLLVYCHEAKVLRLDTGVRVATYHFDGKQVSSKATDYEKLNAMLNKAENKLNNILQRFRNEYEFDPDIHTVRELYNKEETKYNTSEDVKQVLEEWIPIKKALVKQNTIKIYTTLLNDLNILYKSRTLRFRDINEDFKNEYMKFLLSKGKDNDKKGIQNPTILKRFQALQVFLNECPKNEYKFYKDFEIKLKKIKKQPVIIPTEDEFRSLLVYNFELNRLAKARDLFCLSCLTGLRYSDIMKLNKDGLVKIGEKWKLKTIDKKTETFVTIPIHSLAVRILERLEFRIKPISNQKLNQNLEDAFKETQLFNYLEMRFEKRGTSDVETIYEPKYMLMNFHAGRRFFISSLANGGVAIGNIKKWSGHNTQIVEQYIAEGYKEEEQMKKLFSRFEQPVKKKK